MIGGDVDSDGRIDLVSRSGSQITTYLDRSVADQTCLIPVSNATQLGTDISASTLVNLDGDAADELVIFDRTALELRICEYAGDDIGFLVTRTIAFQDPNVTQIFSSPLWGANAPLFLEVGSGTYWHIFNPYSQVAAPVLEEVTATSQPVVPPPANDCGDEPAPPPGGGGAIAKCISHISYRHDLCAWAACMNYQDSGNYSAYVAALAACNAKWGPVYLGCVVAFW